MKMTNGNILGEKIKKLRKDKKLTQKDIAGEKMTRNMISQIENGIASPSLSALKFIADKLEVPPAYLISDDDLLFVYEKNEAMENIYSLLQNKNYQSCIYNIKKLSKTDNELAYILTLCYFELGKKHIMNGSLLTALKNFQLSEENAKKTVFDTSNILALIPMYSAVAKNIQSPLLELNSDDFKKSLNNFLDYEFFKYLTLDFNFNYTNNSYKLHCVAKTLIKERRYKEAIDILLSIADKTKGDEYNAYLIFGVYTDLEYCYKSVLDFEKAYIYSNKRLTLIEAFKS
jgi:transcriptional regulator with XRE-family HTH domain